MGRFYPILVVVIVLFAAFLFSCGDSTTSTSSATLTLINVSPATATLEADETQEFTATGVYSNGSTASVIPTWGVSGGIGTVEAVGYTGLFTASTEGTGYVTAVYSDKSAFATITVSGESSAASGLSTIEVSPATLSSQIGKSSDFTASGIDTTGESITISPSWEISGEAIGFLTVSETIATLEVTAEGFATIICTSGEVVAYSYVTIEGYYLEITAEVDTYVDESASGEAYGSDNTLKAGREVIGETATRYETYINFDLSDIPATATIESASLTLYATSTDGEEISLARISTTEVWNAATTWGTKPTTGSFIYISGQAFSSGLNVVTLTSTVQDWVTDSSNNGLALYLDSPATGYVILVSRDDVSEETRRPKLTVYYAR